VSAWQFIAADALGAPLRGVLCHQPRHRTRCRALRTEGHPSAVVQSLLAGWHSR